MADLSAAVQKARRAGYSDAEIAAYLAKDAAMAPKVAAARKAGYSDADIVAHLGKVDVGKDVVRSGGTGVLRGGAGILDTVMQSNPVTGTLATLENAARVGDLFKGRASTVSPNMFSGGSGLVDRYGHKPQTTAGEWAQTAGSMLPNAALPGTAWQRFANWFLPTIGAEGSAQAVKAMGGDERAQGAARIVGGVAGAGAASIRAPNLFDRRPAPTPEETLATRTRQDPAAMRQRAGEMRAAGGDPTLTDVVDDAGRGAIRAAANRQTPGRQVANDFARSRVLDAPDRISRQARRVVSNDPRTPDQIRTDMAAQRETNANQAFGAVRGDTVQLSPEGVQALRTDYGRAAITEAARRERDPAIRAALNRLAGDALDNPSTPITVGMADRISRVLLSQAQAAGGDRDLAATLGGLGRAIREPTAAASPGYRQALADYGADTRLQEAAGVGEGLMRRNTDEFVAAANGLSPEERQLALAAGRRAVERSAGENPSSAPGVARRLADAPEQQQRNAALMGPARAGEFQNAMRQEARAVENAQAIAPRAGSSTFLNAADDSALRQVAGGVGDALRGRFGALGVRIYDAWRTRGMNDQQIEALVRTATDPTQTDAAINAIAARLQPQQRQAFLELRNAWQTGALTAASTASAAAVSQDQPGR